MSGGCSSPEQARLAKVKKAGKPPLTAEVLGAGAPAACLSRLRALVPQWEDLAANALEPSAFYEHWALLPALEAYSAGQDFRCVAIWSGDQLCALFPFERLRRWRGLPVAALRSWRHRHCVLATPLIRAGQGAAAIAALFDWLRAEGDAAVIEFDYVAADGPFQAALLDATAARDLQPCAMDGFTRALLVKQASADAYLESSLSRNYRMDLRRLGRRLEEQGKVERIELQPGGDVGRWVDDFLELEAKGWKGENGTALKCRPEDRQFAAAVFAGAFARGRLLALGIDLDGKPLSRLFGFTAGEGSFVFKTAYDEENAKFSPGAMVEVDWTRRVHDLPALRWTDSYTSPGNEMIKRLWKDNRVIHRIAVGVGTRGELAVAAIPLLRRLKKLMLSKTVN